MSIEEITSTLEERGVIWQAVGFALIGAGSLLVLSVYSEADHKSIGVLRLAVTQLHWAFVVAIALVIEGIRSMFKTTTEIRQAARRKAIEKAERRGEERGLKAGKERGLKEGEERGAQLVLDRTKLILREEGIELPSEVEDKLFGNGNGRRWWNRIPPFRSG